MADAKPTKPARAKAGTSLPKPAGSAKQAKAQAKDKDEGPGKAAVWWQASVTFLQEVKEELKRVTWPPKKQTLSATGVVLALVAIISVFLGMVDYVLARVVRLLIS